MIRVTHEELISEKRNALDEKPGKNVVHVRPNTSVWPTKRLIPTPAKS
jgi:hypothetical protein